MRAATFDRATTETRVRVALDLDGTGRSSIATGIGFLDHLLTGFSKHGRIDLEVRCEGDLHVDDHHTAEDVALGIGAALDQALGDRSGVARFGHAYAPLDEALVRAVVDLSGRPWAEVHLSLRRPSLGALAAENVGHVLRSIALRSRTTLHVDVLRAENDHHQAEAAFKATALAFAQAAARSGDGIPSTKGVLS
ncbi:MAG: imidazoleglycerol-phosphate dehydratase HisB [Myxococcota bacterium]|jgi:imidazoleglycerol-phosphate dehydratase